MVHKKPLCIKSEREMEERPEYRQCLTEETHDIQDRPRNLVLHSTMLDEKKHTHKMKHEDAERK